MSKDSARTNKDDNLEKHLTAKITPGPGHYLPLMNPLIKNCPKFIVFKRF